MYKVITVKKEGGATVGYLGEFSTLTEAMDVVNEYNRKADRHPAIATLETSKSENAPSPEKEKRKNPFSFGWDDDEEESEEESEYNEDYWDEAKEEEEEIINERVAVDRMSQRMEEESEWEEEDSYEPNIEEPIDSRLPNFRNPFSSRMERNQPRKNRFVSDRERSRTPRMARQASTLQANKITPKPLMMSTPRQDVYYGIILTNTGEILVREPANHHRGLKWDFYGGLAEHDESPQDAVIRETLEETGFMTRIIKPLGQWKDQKNNYHFFLLKPVGSQKEWDGYGTDTQETWDTILCNIFDAESLIKKNSDSPYRRVLLQVLEKVSDYQRRRRF